MRKIVVTTDLSPESHRAFPHAKELAKLTGASLKLISVVDDPVQVMSLYSMDFVPVILPDLREQLLQRTTESLQALAEAQFSDCKLETRVLMAKSTITQEILDYVLAEAADLIIMATHGRSGMRRLLIGSVAESVARQSSCPVMMVSVRGGSR